MFRPLLLASLLPALAFAQTPAPRLEVTPERARPGDAVMLTVRGQKVCPKATFEGKAIRFFRSGEVCRAVVGIPVEQEPSQLAFDVAGQRAQVQIEPAAFRERTLTVAAQFTKKPSAAVRKRQTADRYAFKVAFDQKFSDALFAKNFALPMTTEMTAPFGDLRLFNGKKQSQHYGMDLDGRIGDPVLAANDGKVVMARNNYAAGRTVVLHHGGDLYTTYFHLEKIEVKQGQKVKRGDRIGQVGKTGRVTGPHLHWGVKAGGIYVDPVSLLRLDFEAE